jgi:ribosome maturation factor RimP
VEAGFKARFLFSEKRRTATFLFRADLRKMKDQKSIINEVARLVEPVLEEMGFELVDVEYGSDRGRRILRIYADSEEGITLDECASISREVGDLIDVEDIIEHKYTLEVSSPGLNRPLKKERDFLWALGKKIKVKMAKPVNNRRNYTGFLQKYQDGILYVDTGQGVASLSVQEIEKCHLVYAF